MNELTLTSKKAALRKQAFAQRKAAKDAADEAQAQRALVDAVLAYPGIETVSAYMPIQTEIDPLPAMMQWHDRGVKVAVPVIQGKGMPLLFRQWTPTSAMIEGDFGALIPRGGETLTPDLVVTPLVAFDDLGNRMGYGGGFYDRTLEILRANTHVPAIGYAFSGQQIDVVPTEPTDQSLDAVVTEKGLTRFR